MRASVGHGFDSPVTFGLQLRAVLEADPLGGNGRQYEDIDDPPAH